MKQSYNFEKDLDSMVKKKICAPLFMENELLVPFFLLKLIKYIYVILGFNRYKPNECGYNGGLVWGPLML